MNPAKTLLALFLAVPAFACLAPATQPAGTSAETGSGFSEPKDGGTFAAGGSGGGGEDVASNTPGPGGSLPSGNPAPLNDYDGGNMCLSGQYTRLCHEGTENRDRVALKGKVFNTLGDPEECSYGGQRALRVIYTSSGKGRGGSLKWYVDVPVAADGSVDAVLSTSDPSSMAYYLVPREQETPTQEKSCANDVCVDADGNGIQDADRCAVVTIAFICSDVPSAQRTVVEVASHLGPLTDCLHYSLVRHPVEKTVVPLPKQ